jgi:hypothetical protein
LSPAVEAKVSLEGFEGHGTPDDTGIVAH